MRRQMKAILAMLFLVPNVAFSEDVKLVIGTEGTYRPMSYFDSSGNLIGFEVELVRAICEEMKAECEFMTMDFDNLVPALNEGRIDAYASGVRITEKRLKVIDFSKKYYTPAAHFVSCNSQELSEITPEIVKGLQIGGQLGASTGDYIDEQFSSMSDVRLYQTMDEVFADLANGRLDLAFASKLVGYDFVKTESGKQCALVGGDFTDQKYFGEGVGIALRKGNIDLKAKLDVAIDAVLTDGTFDELNARYWPFSVK
jgi:lysine-arginine-ornithine-binding protein